MSLSFTANSTDAIDHGSDASLDTLATFTFWAWILPSSTASDRFIFSKVTSGFVGVDLKFVGSGAIDATVDRATTDAGFTSANSTFDTTNWQFVAFTFDVNGSDAASTLNCYRGTLTSGVAEVSYASRTQGSGARASESANNFHVGAYEHTPAESFGGEIDSYGFINRYLSIGELRTIQFTRKPVSGQVILVYGGYNGHGNQPDHSGAGNTGTEEGSVGYSNPAPLPPPFSMNAAFAPATAPAATGPGGRLLLMHAGLDKPTLVAAAAMSPAWWRWRRMKGK